MVLQQESVRGHVPARRQVASVKRARLPIAKPPPVVRGEVHVNLDRCKGCELCIECCPKDVLTLSTEFNSAGYHYPLAATDGCILCQGCMAVCPDFAIAVSAVGNTPPGWDAGSFSAATGGG